MSATTVTTSISYQFEALVGRLLEANRFRFDVVKAIQLGLDFVVEHENDAHLVAIEIKYYRTARAQIALIESAAAVLQRKISKVQDLQGMLVVSCEVSASLKEFLSTKFGLTIVDRRNLFLWATELPEALDELNALLQDERTPPLGSGLGQSSIKSALDLLAELRYSKEDDAEAWGKIFHLQERVGRLKDIASATRLTPSSNIKGRVVPAPEDSTGSKLVTELHALERGKSTWMAYENLCERILRYLFPNDLNGWHQQQRTDDGLSRFDFICRIKPGTEFWSFLIEHLNSRYILFEFKNYTAKIKQAQIHTTEKYLFDKGLRRVAIILSRDGADTNAIKATQAAMRDQGKLMLVLDDGKICEMLLKKQNGDDPTDLLFDVTDKFLLALSR